MSWNVFIVNVVYDDNSPVENAKVVYNFDNQNQYYTGYTGSDGLLKIVAEGAQTNYTNSKLNIFDEELYLESRDNNITIQEGNTYTFVLDCSDIGLTYKASICLIDYLYYSISISNYPIIYQYRLYYKNAQNDYVYQTGGILNHEPLDFYNHRLPTTSIKIELINDEYDSSPFERYFDYSDNEGGTTVLLRVLKSSYDLNFIDINDTIDWYERGKNLLGCDVTFFGYDEHDNLIVSSTTVSTNPTRITVDVNSLYSVSPTAQNTIYNLKNPQKNSFKVTKNHYNDYQANCFISANTDIEFFIIESGKTINDPAIIERESNVCMTNKDLYDYLISLTELRPDLPEEYESNRVGISDTWFTYLWSDSIKRYLDPEYQTITPDTIEDFKTVFVNQLSTTRVSTLYTSPSSIENNYTLDKNHGYVWDRCFIPEEKEFVENCLTFSIDQNESCDISFNYMLVQRTLFDFDYSTNNGFTWNSYSFDQNGMGETISLSPGGNTSVKFRRSLSNTGTTLSTNEYHFYYFSMTGTCSSTGCVNSLLDGYGLSTTEISMYCFLKLFINCVGLRSAPELPATALTEFCYYDMFYGCTSLTTAPELPATTLANFCYNCMFYGCTSLTTAPELPATTLADFCYNCMFYECTSLTTAPELPSTTLAFACYNQMFRGCTSLTTAPTLPATTLANSCYSSMFTECTSLTTAPELPATTLANYCYNNMFTECTSLTTAPELPATTLAQYCYTNMFQGCTSLTTAPELPATTMAEHCYSFMFRGCTSLTNARTLSTATALAESCFEGMFYSCTSLVTAPTLSRSPGMHKNCFKNMFHGCTSLTTMPYTGSTFPWQSHAYGCYEGMFENCTSLRNTPSTIFGYNARDYCFKKMFYGCTSMTNPITLYANNLGSFSGVCESMFEGCTSLASGITANSVKIGPDCYKKMFYGCTNMTYIKANFSATTEGVFNSNNASAFTQDWVSGVSQNGTFMCANSTWYNNYAFNGTNGIPNNWRIGY